MTTRTSLSSERGTALLIVLLMLTLAVGLLGGFITTLATDQQLRGVDQARTRVFYAAHGALEQLTTDLGNLFASNFAPTSADINALTATEPAFNRVVFEDPGGGTGYEITFPQLNGNPDTAVRSILSGPFQGFTGLVTPYSLAVTARSAEETSLSSEVRLERTLQTVAIPLFQFGIFSETDLSYFPGSGFNFGGRIHTNGNLFLATRASLRIDDRVTAVREVIRAQLSNGLNTNTSGYTGVVNIARAPGVWRPLGMNEGSLVGGIGTAPWEPDWTNMSIGDSPPGSGYNGYLRNGRTGARRLDLPFTTLGATPIDLIRRGVPGEHPMILAQRYYQLASMRILLSDSDDLTLLDGLPGVTATPALSLEGGTYAFRPVGQSDGTGSFRSPLGTSLLGGRIKIEIQHPGPTPTWEDVTQEILDLGITGQDATANCAQPHADAIIRLQRLRDNASGPTCNSPAPADYWPNTLYDAREGYLRDRDGLGGIRLAGVMHYVELDVRNLRRWFRGEIGTRGTAARSINGYTVYFSDRRTNRDAAGNETGEFGAEDFVHAGGLDTGEDVNGNGILDTYGASPRPVAGASAPLNTGATLQTSITVADAAIAKSNRAIFFRRALKLVNGELGNLPEDGFTLASENPVYVHGHYNANAAGFGEPNEPAAIIADSVTLLSRVWNDNTSYTHPNAAGSRDAQDTWYRMAVLSGKGPAFTRPGGEAQEDFGTDGGVHNFLRYLEDWSGRTLSYRGSLASLYFNRQAVGTYKCCVKVYDVPSRGYNFDVEFLQPALLPPFTPMFRDVNTTGFTQVIR